MDNNTDPRRTPSWRALLLAAGLLAAGSAHAVDPAEVRVRGGGGDDVGDDGGGTVAVMLEPDSAPAWLTFIGDDVHYEAAATAWLDAQEDGDDVFTVHFGPTWHYAPDPIAPVFVELGTAPTVVSDDQIDGDDIGGEFHFTTHVTVGARFGAEQRWEAGLRVQHMSNVGIDDDNPGVNAALFEVGYRFGSR